MRQFFAAHKRVLIKIIPHHNESVYKFELSHLHLAVAAICSAVVLLAFFVDHMIVVRTAQAQVKSLQAANSSERAQLRRFSKQTGVMMQRLHELQRENLEIKRLTVQVQRKHVEPLRPRSARAAKVPAARPIPQSLGMITRASALPLPLSLWSRITAWISGRRDGGASFASEATQLALLDVELNQALAESRALRAQTEAAALAERDREVAHQRYLDEIPSIWPTEGYISSGFGYRSYPDTEFHPGLDIVNDYGSPIYATAAGVVTESGWDGGYGYEIRIDHGNGFETMYAHDSQLLVSSGQYVRKGQEIALVGTTGFATGPHVHYELLRYGTPIDPQAYLNGIPSTLAKADPY